MKLFGYIMSIDHEDTVGIVQAKNIYHARQILSEVYDEWHEADTDVKEIEYDGGVCEIYYA